MRAAIFAHGERRRAPIGRDEVSVDTETLQDVCRHFAKGLYSIHVLRDQTGNRLVRITALRQEAFGAVEVTPASENFTAFLIVEWCARCEETEHRLP